MFIFVFVTFAPIGVFKKKCNILGNLTFHLFNEDIFMVLQIYVWVKCVTKIEIEVRKYVVDSI